MRQFAIDRLKIDRSFVRDLPQDTDAKAIIRATVAMGRSLGLRVMAEGVETEGQAEYLRSVQCDESQGYLYARPMRPDDFEAWLKGRKPDFRGSRYQMAQS
ncbi:EAL domain-containing protein [Nitrosospira multiformis ATCC 25196]|uniref:EAL domain-containing protein n=1 Tax=Nitrosospira multiformis (strain ATCC 25196 / NCIMB 11849 / C 71) TaxID=323848 RepID=A0A1H5SQP2_NITMU|nr:EAL domain-containing protein [Nitrosospira multiformis]SEF52869.1 EAL domain-containing protein [Nitrosospira multiformis ATCC 25196]